MERGFTKAAGRLRRTEDIPKGGLLQRRSFANRMAVRAESLAEKLLAAFRIGRGDLVRGGKLPSGGASQPGGERPRLPLAELEIGHAAPGVTRVRSAEKGA